MHESPYQYREKNMDVEQTLLTVDEAARSLRISRSALFQLMSKDGGLPSITIGRSRRIPASALREWVDRQVTEGNGPRAA
jgi:excisionase family DNA binding protein